jgi:cation diffusion facilitator CzcD-associated flavoprotein CzcO
MRHIRFDHEVANAIFDESRGIWLIRFGNGATTEARVLISAVGQLHRPVLPDIPGLETFKGPVFHSARWDHSFDPAGKTVASIGAGPSAIQYVPEIAKQARQLHVFQRTPAWCVHKADRAYRGRSAGCCGTGRGHTRSIVCASSGTSSSSPR